MARRPVFISGTPTQTYHEVTSEFEWFPGFSLAQKQRSIQSLHENFLAAHPQHNVLEISSKSTVDLGLKLSAFNLTLKYQGATMSVEAAFQGSKIFEHGGPFTEIYGLTAREAKRFPKLKESGKLCAFSFHGIPFPLTPTTFFYDYLYASALHSHPTLAQQVCGYTAFSDIEFNPARQRNCQARSVAIYVTLAKYNLCEHALATPTDFRAIVYP